MAPGKIGTNKGQQQSPPGKSILPILSYYLTFIHYFGFSINPNDDSNQRYLSIRVKRVPQADRMGTTSGASLAATGDQWLASYKMRARSTFTGILMSSIRMGIKFTAISFTTFLTLNHCIVLVDYICRGTKEFEELMFDVRLVITKFSALIFVLSWHCKQSQVRQLIKLVKSTSIYILGTSLTASKATATTTTSASCSCCCDGETNIKGAGFDIGGSPGDHSEPQSPQPQQFAGKNRPEGVVYNQANKDEPFEDNKRTTSGNKSSMPSFDKIAGSHQNRQLGGGGGGGGGDEIGDCNHLIHESITQRIDRRILKWWLMCVSVTVLHFSLSEAEITKSHHLWQWLDDYSLHQLNNQTTSESTLLFLASFDNYIYTVHVYGTRLIGASIICIVCSFQCENISSLRWHTLRLIRSSTNHHHQASVLAPNALTSLAPAVQRPPYLFDHTTANQISAALTQTLSSVKDSNNNHDAHGDADLRNRSWQWQHLFASYNLKDIARNAAAKRGLQHQTCGRCCRLHVAQPPQQQEKQHYYYYSSQNSALRTKGCLLESCQTDRDLFFVLGESDWIQVRENVALLNPRGYLSSSIWSARICLLELASQLLRLILFVCSRALCATIGQISKIQINKVPPKVGQHELPSEIGTHLAKDRHLPNRAHCSASFSCLFPLRAEALSDAYSDLNNSKAIRWATPTSLTEAAPAPVNRPPDNVGTNYNATTRRSDFCDGPTPIPMRCTTNQATHDGATFNTIHYHHQKNQIGSNFAASDAIEWQLERLASKYELVRTVNGRIDSCFGPMLLIQFSFLFLMSCIDVVYFSICFNPNTKTKYIIISGMILLWWPYLLLYKFASDMGSKSKELLISVRRLARLSLILSHSPQSNLEQQTLLARERSLKPALSMMSHLPPSNSTVSKNDSTSMSFFEQQRKRFFMFGKRSYLATSACTRSRARIINKLDHVFKPTTLSILDILTVDKFFLLNFAKIVITASVMIIQFISK